MGHEDNTLSSNGLKLRKTIKYIRNNFYWTFFPMYIIILSPELRMI